MPIKANLDRLLLEPGQPDQMHAPIKRSRLNCVPAQRLPESSAYAPLCLEEICICRKSHHLDECGTKSSLSGSRSRTVTQTRAAVPKMPGASQNRAYAPLCLEVIGICLPSHQPDECGTRTFFRWVRAQGRSPDTPGISKNASAPVGIPLKRSASGTRR